MTETTAPVQSLHDQIMRLPCTPPKDANVNQSISYKSGHRDARHAAAELAAEHEAEQQQELTAIEAMARMLADGEWAEHVGQLGGPIAQRLETEITRMHNEQQAAQAAVPDENGLLPCPFCGGKAELHQRETESLWSHNQVTWSQVGCCECECVGADCCEDDDGSEAAAHWNTRAADHSAPTPPAGPWESPCTPPAQPVAVPDELRAKAEKFVISRRKAAEFDRVAESELEDEDADEAQACAVQAFFHEEAAALVEQLLSAAPTPPARQPDAVSGLVNALERYTAFAATRRDELGELSREMEDVDAFACDALAKYRATPAQQSQWVPDECPHVIWFDDADREPILFAGAGAREAAMKAWEKISGQWNAHLFVRTQSNSRDDRYPCAMPTAPGDTTAPAQAEQPNDEPTPPEALASRLISVWVETHGKPIPWAHAVRITGIATNLPQQEIDRLLAMDDAVTVPIHERWAEVESICWRIFEDGKKEFRGCTKERLEELRALLGGGE